MENELLAIISAQKVELNGHFAHIKQLILKYKYCVGAKLCDNLFKESQIIDKLVTGLRKEIKQ